MINCSIYATYTEGEETAFLNSKPRINWSIQSSLIYDYALSYQRQLKRIPQGGFAAACNE